MAQIVTLTGIKAATLRKWESRYSFLKPERTDTNIRYFSDEQLKKLLNISILTRHGYRISKIDKMSLKEMYQTVTGVLIDTNEGEDEINALILHMLDMNEAEFKNVLTKYVIKRGLFNTVVKLVYPFLKQVGILWGTDKVMPAQEHFISNLIKQKIFSAIEQLPLPAKSTSSIVLFLPEGENHEIGLLLTNYIAKELGWKTYYLGQNVPTRNLKQVVEIANPTLFFTMFITTNVDNVENMLNEICKQTATPILVSGNPINFKDVVLNKQTTYLASPDDFINYLTNYK
jgi:DNA-binding transcriptional MerR regulator